jgi:hypothetical protein
MVDDGPVDQIVGVKHGNTRETGETGCYHIEIIACTNYIRVGIVGVYYGIAISPVPIIGLPYLSG